jgi:hypothetical protein
MKLKGGRFEIVTSKGNRKRYSTALRPSTVLLKSRKNDWIAVFVPIETILKEMAAKNKLCQNFFSDPVRELSDTPRMHVQSIT